MASEFGLGREGCMVGAGGERGRALATDGGI